MQEITTNSDLETRELGKKIAQHLSHGKVFLLTGDLGSGKTTFVQGFAEGLGITRRISSPTFIIMRTYTLKSDTLNTFYHLDLYRTSTKDELTTLGIDEILSDPANVVMIEWPERLGRIPKNSVTIIFSYIDENERKIVIDEN